MSEHITLSELQNIIKMGITNAHPLPYWVVAEVSELKVNYSGHCYLELVEKGGDNHVPKAKASAVAWRQTFGMLQGYFTSVTGQELCAGIKLLVKVTVTYHELYGLSLQITDIDPTYTLGDMERQRRETVAQLQQEGVFDMNRELILAEVVQRIAVVSSANAAGYRDFMKEIEDSQYRFEIILFDAFMQGAGAEESIINALSDVAEREGEFDAVVIIRGGGSQSDLGCFNSYRLCSYVAQFPLPVIAGIGHDKDSSVVDMVAFSSLKTPTAVAVFLKDRIEEFDRRLDEVFGEIHCFVHEFIADEGERLHTFALQLLHASRYATSMQIERLNAMTQMLLRSAKGCVVSASKELSLLSDLVATHDPKRIMSRGFAYVKCKGQIVKCGRELQKEDNIEIVMSDSVVDATVLKIR